GTTSTRSILVNKQGKMIAQDSQPFQQYFPKPGWVEHDPEEIWQSVLKTMKAVIKKSKINSEQIHSIGITNQRETVVAWNKKTGQSLYHAIVWQCRRTETHCQKIRLKEKGKLAKKIHHKTGLMIDPYFSSTKMSWLLNNVRSVKAAREEGNLCFGTIDAYLLFRLTSGNSFFTDVSNASRTMLMNLETTAWDLDLLNIFGIHFDELPQIQSSDALFGKTKGVDFLSDSTSIHGVLGDQQAALFGQLCFKPTEVKCTFGTGSFILFNTGTKKIRSKSKLLTTVAWKMGTQKTVYALEGGAFVCGAAVQWLRDQLGMIKSSDEIETLAQSVSGSEGVEFVPALTGLGAPYWRADARGVICGLTRGSNKSHIAYATLEAMALQNVEIIQAMENDMGKKIKTLKVDGGATANQLLLQLQSDFLGAQVIRPKELETTALGVAYMAGLGSHFWSGFDEIEKLWIKQKDFLPQMNLKTRTNRMTKWRNAVARTF
ncbi:MAG: glycerol kinase GlpK, partial [Pseudobdellovibrionaceae bacterium]